MRKLIIYMVLVLNCLSANAQDVELYGIPIDFSRVGYRWGDEAIPTYPAEIILEAPQDGSDATLLIQMAVNNAQPGTAVLLKKGTYNVSGSISFEKSHVVLRGEGNGTVIVATGKNKRDLIKFGKRSKREELATCEMTGDFVPAGQMFVNVKRPSMFKVGDRITINYPPNEKWISEIKMDQLYSKKGIEQWTPPRYRQAWERIVVKVEGKAVWLDNPVVLEMNKKYADRMYVALVKQDRVEESGIENLMLVSEYEDGNLTDEEHAESAISVGAAEHCWFRNIKSAHFAHSLMRFGRGAKNITVESCRSTAPISQITGGRRYAFHIMAGELCLIKNCIADHDRHGFVTARVTPGPNVFLECVMSNAHAGMGPHHRWATGVLYDCCSVDGLLEVRDRAHYGTGHGWAGANFVLWNCMAEKIDCQSPWKHAKNWAVGCVGERVSTMKYKDDLQRPDGEWFSHGQPVEPRSLYRYQLEERRNRE